MLKGMRNRMMIFMSKRMIACDEAGFLISYHQDNRLGFMRWMQLKMHLLSCHICRKYVKQIKQLDHQVAEYRVNSMSEPCQHHLSEKSCTQIQEVVDKELNVK